MSHLQARYSRIDDVAVSSLQETPDGPLGRLNISGHMVPSAETTEESAEGRARATALAFMMEEAELLGIQSPAEFREIGLTSLQNGSTSVDYVRMVGDLQLLETQIRFDLDADGVITRVDATLRPVPEELLRAASRTTLSDEEVVRIVEEDLAWPEGGQAVEIAGAPQEYATWLPPFVIWAVAGSRGDRPAWSYTIDAFTGQVLSKNCTSRTISQVRSTTPCD